MKRLWPILAALILAAALRIIGAGGYPVWTDEGWSIWASSDPTQVVSILAADRHPPLYFAVLSIWRLAAGDTHIALRFLSIAAGLLLVALVYRLAADVFGRRAAMFAALLFAALPIAVYYAQEVRHYGWLALFSTLAWLIFLRYLRKPSRGLWIAYVLSITALAYTLYFGAFTLLMQGIVVLVVPFVDQRRDGQPSAPILNAFRRWLPFMLAWLTAAILYIPWFYVIVTQQADILGSGINGFPGTLTATVLPVLQTVFSTQIVIPLAAFVVGVWAIVRQPTLPKIALLLGGGGLLILMFILSIKSDFLAARTLEFVTPLLMIVGGYGLSRIDWRIGTALVAVWIIATLTLPQIVQPRLDSNLAGKALATAYQPGDAVIIEAGWDDNAFAYEIGQALVRTSGSPASITRTLPWTNDRTGGAPVVPQIEPILKSHQRVWIVQWLQAPQVLPFLQGGGDGFRPAQTLDISAGAYGAQFYAPTIQIRLFVKQSG